MTIKMIIMWYLCQGRSKIKPFQSVERVSPVPAAFRKPTRPKPPPPSSSKSGMASKASGLHQSKPLLTQPKTTAVPITSDPKPKSTSRSTHSLKDRIIHMLALKPYSREQIVSKLKKGEVT